MVKTPKLTNVKSICYDSKIQTFAPLPLPPGRYQLDWWESQHQSKRETLVEEFEVEPGTVMELEI